MILSDVTLEKIKKSLNQPDLRIYNRNISTNMIFLFESSISSLSYIKVKDIIIIPTIRELFMKHSGHVNKFFSHYAEFLYKEVDPVFVGTENDLQILRNKILHAKSLDILHKDDLLIDWLNDDIFNHKSN